MKFNFEKKCATKNCRWVVWDGCIINAGCFTHCTCPENKTLKKLKSEKIEYLKKQSEWENQRR